MFLERITNFITLSTTNSTWSEKKNVWARQFAKWQSPSWRPYLAPVAIAARSRMYLSSWKIDSRNLGILAQLVLFRYRPGRDSYRWCYDGSAFGNKLHQWPRVPAIECLCKYSLLSCLLEILWDFLAKLRIAAILQVYRARNFSATIFIPVMQQRPCCICNINDQRGCNNVVNSS